MSPPNARVESPPRPTLRAFAEAAMHVRATLALVWKSSRSLTVAMASLTLVGAVLPLGIAFAGKRIVDSVVAGDKRETTAWVATEFAIVVGQAILSRALSLSRSLLGARLGVDINVAILRKALSLELRYFEDSEFYDSLTRARREASSRPVALVGDAFLIVQNVVTLLGYVLLLLQFSGWAVLALVVSTVPATVAEMRLSKNAFRIRNWRSPDSRRLLYLEYVLANDEHAKEVKLFGLGPLLMDRYTDLAEQFYREDKKLAVTRAAITQALALLATFALYGAYAATAILAAAGRLTLGSMTLYVMAFRNGQQSFQSLLGAIGSVYEHNLYMSNLFSFLALPGGSEPEKAENGRNADAPGAREPSFPAWAEDGIVFDNVGFRYPDKDTWALRGISVRIGKGESIALVGQNGAGKTTFIKLLTRLYEPTEGRIVLDGRDLRDWDVTALRARFGVVFQDFNQYQFTVRENVGVGSVAHRDDDTRIARAVQSGGAEELVAALPKGVETPLGKWFRDGTELSGGQWQKIALSRAFMREEADILVLDEPTAALDAHAEHAVFTRFRELAKGRTTIVISHRFPTVRMADRILVIEAGRIVEQGTHDALVASGGRYATMFALQAEGYR